ncbi:MAG: threonylcarbamoyl-AMP synthase [Gammaproteobacteria bacterium]|nr:threonylcarbamoyl-AMP synthase [Gammaproteobacteria bacterium]
MGQYFHIHPDNPQPRLINQVVVLVREGGLIIYPTDSGYALGCHIGDKAAQDRIRRIRRLDDKHNFTLVCRDLSEISTYAKVDNAAYRFMKSHTPGAYTFILKATHEVPRRLQNPRRKTIGIRVPDNNIAMSLLDTLGEPLMSSTLILPGEEMPLTDADDIQERLGKQVELVIDGGYCGFEPTTVVDMMGEVPTVVRVGKGDTTPFGS